MLVPSDGGVFSALGLAAAERRRDETQTVLLSERRISAQALADLIGDADAVSWDIRYRGQSFELTVEDRSGDPVRMRDLFEQAHESRYSYRDPDQAIELVTVRRRFLEPGPGITVAAADSASRQGPDSIDLGQATIWLPEGWTAQPDRAGLIRLSRQRAM